MPASTSNQILGFVVDIDDPYFTKLGLKITQKLFPAVITMLYAAQWATSIV
jgi:hypothetical protein